MKWSQALSVLLIMYFQLAFSQERINLDQYLKSVGEQNLSLKIESAKLNAAQENARGLTIPPPMVGYMRMQDQSGSSANGFEINQTIPFPSKLSNDSSARNFEAQAQQENRLATESEILAMAKVTYVNLWVSQQRKSALKEKREVLQGHIKLSRASARSDSFSRIHLLRAESDYDLLENEILSSEQDIKEKQAAMSLLINAAPENFHPTLEDPPLSKLPSENIFKNSHQLEFAKLNLESFKEREQEAKSSWFPDLYLRYKEIGETQLMPRTSEVMIGVSLPFLFPWEPSSTSGKASAMKMQAELGLEQQTRMISSQQRLLLSKAISLKEQLDNITQKLLPRAEKRMRLVHTLAPRDMETLQDHRETMEAFPELKLKALDLRVQYETTIAELMKYKRGNE